MSNATTKRKPQIGDTCWRVEWVSKMAFDDNGDCDHDRCTSSYKCFPTYAEALAFAVETWPSTVDKFGIVELDEMEFKQVDDDFPWIGQWELIGETKILSDDGGVPE